jgi:hypothetical protein
MNKDLEAILVGIKAQEQGIHFGRTYIAYRTDIENMNRQERKLYFREIMEELKKKERR